MSFSPQFFLSNLKSKDGPARPSRFEVFLPIPSYINNYIGTSLLDSLLNLPNTLFSEFQNSFNQASGDAAARQQAISANSNMSRYLSLQCESTELPGKTLQTADVKIYGPTYKVPYQSQYNDISMTFLCTNEFYERKLFERWMEAIMPTDTSNMRYPKGENSRYLCNPRIIQYDDFIKRIYIVELIDAFPIGISPQQVSWADDNFHRLTVQFSYHKYRPIYDGEYNLAQAAEVLFGSKVAGWFDNKVTDVGNSISGTLANIF